jgi:hypothetical protein
MSDPGAMSWAIGAESEPWTSTASRTLGRDYVVFDDVHSTTAILTISHRSRRCLRRRDEMDEREMGVRRGKRKIDTAVKQAQNAVRLLDRRFPALDIQSDAHPVVIWGGGIKRWNEKKAQSSVGAKRPLFPAPR